MPIPGADKAIENLIKWAFREQWAPLREEVFAAHFDMVCDRFDVGEEEIAELLGDAFGMVYGCVLEEFFVTPFDEDGATVIDDYLKRRGWREKVPAKRYLEGLRDSVVSLYEVVDLTPGRRMTVRDMIRGGDPVAVDEKRGSETAAQWDRIAARVVTVNRKNYFTGPILQFSHEVADHLLSGVEDMVEELGRELRKEAKKLGEPADFEDGDLLDMFLGTSAHLFTQAWLISALERASAPLPEMRNTDGDEIMFSEVRFPITGEATDAALRLDDIGVLDRDDPDTGRWTWHGRGSPSQRVSRKRAAAPETDEDAGRTILGHVELRDGALVLTTNSRERADRGRDMLASALAGLVGRPLTSHQALETMLEEHGDDPAPSASAEIPPELAEQALHAYLDHHYRRSLDQPLPYLDGKTPRLAARTKAGRGRVAAWLKKLENSESRRAAGQGQHPYDFRWMWRELKIEDLR